MAYITGSVTDPSPAAALYALMVPALTTAGFTLVDTVTISTRTHKVWKSPAAANAQNLDWYLDIAYTTTGVGTISLVAFEMFDPATDLGYRGPYNGNGQTIVDAATGSRFGAVGYALESTWFGAQQTNMQMALTTTAFAYWMTITADRVMFLYSGQPTLVMYAGFYLPDPLYAAKAGAMLFPLYSGRAPGTAYSSPNSALTRIPPLTSFPPGWDASINCGHGFINGSYPELPTNPTTAYPFSAMPMSIAGGPNSKLGRYGQFRDFLVVPASTVLRGDTCTIDGAPYVLTSASSYSYAIKAV
jgi:hypothetical protein